MKSTLISLICLFSGLFDAEAQKVQRKGTTPAGRPGTPVKNTIIFSLDSLQGRWQEIIRMEPATRMAESFTDTLLIKIEGRRGEVKDATSMSIAMKGDASVEDGNSLFIAADVFTIRSLKGGRLELDDGNRYRILERKSFFYHETVGKNPVAVEKFDQPLPVVDAAQLRGKWTIYRRQAEAGLRQDAQALIKSIQIHDQISNNKLSGEIAFFTGNVTRTLPCTLLFDKGNTTIETAEYNWVFQTYKATADEWVFGEAGSFLYFAKH